MQKRLKFLSFGREALPWRYKDIHTQKKENKTIATPAIPTAPPVIRNYTPTADRNVGMELVRVTEAAALAAVRWFGRGDKNGADQAAVDAMNAMLATVDMDGIVVIGEGEKDKAPMLYNSQTVGNGFGVKTDVAVDPIDGTTILSEGREGSIAVIAVAPRGSMIDVRDFFYLDKIVVGREARGKIDITASPEYNIIQVARALDISVASVVVTILKRDRNNAIIEAVRNAGARINLIGDGDIAGALVACMNGTGAHMLLGSGGAPEAVTAACGVKALRGDMQCRPFISRDEERQAIQEKGIDPNRVMTLDDLVSSDDTYFAATGVTNGTMLHGVQPLGHGVTISHSIVMRGITGTVRRIETEHTWDRDS